MRVLLKPASVLLLVLAGCAASPGALETGATKIRVAKADPPENYEELGPVSGSNGSGCGGYGAQGSYEGAVTDLKNQAFKIGADFVQIMTVTEPHVRPFCFDNVYRISGNAYRKVGDAPKSTTASPPTSAATRSATQKLQELQDLRDKKLITADEYEKMRKQILSSY